MNVSIIAAAGQGTRMAGSRPKQFLELAGIPILFHTLKVFERCDVIDQVIAVVPAEESAGFFDLSAKYGLTKLARIVEGGSTRAESVLKGLLAAPETTDIVVIHDGVRPFVTPDEITRTVKAASSEGAAILVSQPVDTVKEVRAGKVIKTLNRNDLRNALTPQSFQYTLLRRAYEQVDVFDPSLTDESSIAERAGMQIATVEGSARNIKITTAADLILAEAMLNAEL
ncbi:MAG TPA: 2-C-methyl-D-erythritol 4-phosphate cytidylyltransferase [Pyrinomonadaceae bacterium]|nr:2-C-methyl-D-erythritol 4-phosphate cytidylyltransferase [Pyrinomonadaceae bacterium]